MVQVNSHDHKEIRVPAKFVVKKGSTGKYRFSLLSARGQVVATSEAYASKAGAMGGIKAMQKLAADAPVEDQTTAAWAKEQQQLKAAKAGRKTTNGAAKKAPAPKASGPRASAAKSGATSN